MYVWQMNNGRWQVDRYTSTKFDVRMMEFNRGYETRFQAETALETWRKRYPDAVKYAYSSALDMD